MAIFLGLMPLLGIGQSYTECGNSYAPVGVQPPSLPPPPSGCDVSSPDFSAFYKHMESYVPDAGNSAFNAVDKTIHVNFHIWQDQNGEGNLYNTPWIIARLNQVIDDVNFNYETPSNSTDPQLSYTVDELTHTYLHVELDSIYFYQDSTIDQHLHLSDGYGHNIELDDYLEANYPERQTGLAIHIARRNFSSNWGGYSDYGSIETYYRVNPEMNFSTDHDWWFQEHIGHEMGHSLDLWHTYDVAPSWQQNCNPNYEDFLTDVYDPAWNGSTSCVNMGNCTVGLQEGAACSDNLMSGPTSHHISRLQTGIMHRSCVLINQRNTRYNDWGMPIRDHVTGYSTIPFIVSTDQTWDFSMKFYQDLVIEDGATLTVQCELQFVPQAKIIVKQGGKLILDGGKLTNERYYRDYWQGIFVEGDPAGQYSYNNLGRVLFKNHGIIENARTGVRNFGLTANGQTDWSKTGGVIQSYGNVTFLNNRKDVEFLAYQNYNSNGQPRKDFSYFKNTNFITNDDRITTAPMDDAITMYKCNSPKVHGCRFEDQRTTLAEPWDHRRGIYMIKSTLRLDEHCQTSNCNTPIRSEFKNLNHGIYSIDDASALYNTEIKNADFISCWNGAYLLNASKTDITNNNFEVTPYQFPAPTPIIERPTGLYLHHQTDAYRVEGNNFYHDPNSTGPSSGPDQSYGIVVATQTGNNERIYRNTFTHLTVGTESLGQNRFDAGTFHTGVQFRCNDYNTSSADIYVADGGYTSNYMGICQDQGYQPDDPTLNTFEVSPHYNILNEEDFFAYRYDNNDPAQFPTNAVSQAPPVTVSLEVAPQGLFGCDDFTALQSENVLLSKIQNTYNGMMQKDAELAALLDGGDTEGLKADVVLTTNSDAWQKYMDLMSKAGYVSETVLKEVSAKETGFTDAMIRDILVANPHAAKSKEVEQKLDERSNPLPEYMKDQIKGGKSQTSSKELLQMQKDGYKRQHDQAVASLYRTLLQDEDPMSKVPTLVSVLSGTGDIRFDYDLVELYDATDQAQLADALLGVMDVNHDLDGKQQAAYDRYVSYRAMIKDWEANGKDLMALDASDIAILESYIDNFDRTSGKAMGLLELNGALNIVRPVVEPNVGVSRLAAPQDEDIDAEGLLEVFPNPAKEFFTLRYRVDRAFRNAQAVIIDVSGKVVHRITIVSQEDELIVSKSLPSGTYHIKLLVNNEPYRSISLIIK